MSRTLRLDFGNLPLVEAAARASFGSPIPLTFSVINDVHERLRDEFPDLREPKQFEVAPGIDSRIPLGPGQISGVVYAGNLKGLLITVQSQVVVARWLKQIVKNAPEYPRFAQLRDVLWRAVEAFRTASGCSELSVATVNMSYVNFLDVDDMGGVLKRYFSDLAHIKATADAKQIHKVEASWRERDDVDLRFHLEKVTAQLADQTMEGYRLTTIAGARLLKADDDAKDRLEYVHSRLQSFFRDLISDHAKAEWQLNELTNG